MKALVFLLYSGLVFAQLAFAQGNGTGTVPGHDPEPFGAVRKKPTIELKATLALKKFREARVACKGRFKKSKTAPVDIDLDQCRCGPMLQLALGRNLLLQQVVGENYDNNNQPIENRVKAQSVLTILDHCPKKTEEQK